MDYDDVSAWRGGSCQDNQAFTHNSIIDHTQLLETEPVTLDPNMSIINEPTNFSSYDLTESVSQSLSDEEQRVQALDVLRSNEGYDNNNITGLSASFPSSWPYAGDQICNKPTKGGTTSNNHIHKAHFKTPQVCKPPRLNSSCIRCWQHGCDGRTFSSLSNYRRHCKEKNQHQSKAVCYRCGRSFSRTAGRDLHYSERRCLVTLLDANGIPFRTKLE